MPLAPQLADLANVAAGQRVLDVGCGPGALTAELVSRLGPGGVAAVDPSASFVRRCRSATRSQRATRRSRGMPFEDGAFDATLARLVVHFMAALSGLREMAAWPRAGDDGGVRLGSRRRAGGSPCTRTRRGSSIPASMTSRAWRGGRGPLGSFSERLGFRRSGERAGDRRASDLRGLVGAVHARRGTRRPVHDRPGPGRAGSLRERCREQLPAAPFAVTALAWAARGLA